MLLLPIPLAVVIVPGPLNSTVLPTLRVIVFKLSVLPVAATVTPDAPELRVTPAKVCVPFPMRV